MSRSALLLGAGGAAAFALAQSGWPPLVLARLAICGAALGAAAAIDIAEHRIPNRLVLPAATACALLSIAAGLSSAVLAGIALVAILLLLSAASPRALGMGDVKLALLIVLGLDGDAPRALALGLILAALAGTLLLLRSGRRAGRRSLPLAPFLATGALLVLL